MNPSLTRLQLGIAGGMPLVASAATVTAAQPGYRRSTHLDWVR